MSKFPEVGKNKGNLVLLCEAFGAVLHVVCVVLDDEGLVGEARLLEMMAGSEPIVHLGGPVGIVAFGKLPHAERGRVSMSPEAAGRCRS